MARLLSFSGPPAISGNVEYPVGEAKEISWGRLLWLPLVGSMALLILPQGAFVWLSFHGDLGMGQVSPLPTLANYVRLLSDPFYLRAIWTTTYLAAVATTFGLLVAFPTAYSLARIGGWIATMSLSLILAASLITIVIKVIGLQMLLGPSGVLNQLLLGVRVIKSPLEMVNNRFGVLVGLVQYTLPILVLLLFGVVQTIPSSLEEAAEIHGAHRPAIFFQIILPIAKQGLVSAGLIAFNMCMGAFTSPLILGGGRVLTMPVLIQQKIIVDAEYGVGAALSMVLLVFVFIVNLLVGAYLLRERKRQRSASWA